jgi:hypothetical protein
MHSCILCLCLLLFVIEYILMFFSYCYSFLLDSMFLCFFLLRIYITIPSIVAYRQCIHVFCVFVYSFLLSSTLLCFFLLLLVSFWRCSCIFIFCTVNVLFKFHRPILVLLMYFLNTIGLLLWLLVEL